MKGRIRRLCMLISLALLHTYTEQHTYTTSFASKFISSGAKAEPNIVSSLIRSIIVWGLCELLFWAISKRKK